MKIIQQNSTKLNTIQQIKGNFDQKSCLFAMFPIFNMDEKSPTIHGA
jgi:hypothetical protein